MLLQMLQSKSITANNKRLQKTDMVKDPIKTNTESLFSRQITLKIKKNLCLQYRIKSRPIIYENVCPFNREKNKFSFCTSGFLILTLLFFSFNLNNFIPTLVSLTTHKIYFSRFLLHRTSVTSTKLQLPISNIFYFKTKLFLFYQK